MKTPPRQLCSWLRCDRQRRPRAGVTLLLLGLAALLNFVAGCRTPEPAFTEVMAPGDLAGAMVNPASPAARLNEGDVLRIVFEGDTNLNTVAKIQLDGTINLQLVGDVKAVGKSVLELQADLMAKYQPLLKVNELTVTLVSTSAGVYISGAVLRPGRVPLDRPLTALEAIMEAGGFDLTRAKPSAVTVLRVENGQQKHYRVNLQKALRGDDPVPFLLRPFDIVHVPAKVFNY